MSSPSRNGQDRYARVRQLGWDVELLKSSTVLVVGAGALGNEIIKDLVLAGVGHLLIVDPDIIETHNLTRSALFRPKDVGRPKAQVAAEAAREIEPDVDAVWYHSTVQSTLGLGVFRTVDVVLGGVDNLQTRRDLNRACMATGTPFIDGGLFYLDGDVRVFLPPFPVCFDCTLTHEEREEGWRRWSCLKLASGEDAIVGPTAPTVAAMVGGLQAQLSLKYIHREQSMPYRMTVPNGVRIRFNGFADEYERWDLARDPQCPTHMGSTRVPDEAVVSLPDGNDMDAALLLEQAQERLGPDAYVELGFDVVHTLTRFECGASEPAMRREGTLTVGEAICARCTPTRCAHCGEPISTVFEDRPDLVFPDRLDCPRCFKSNGLVIRGTESLNRIEPGSPALGHSLAELGVPLLDILEAKAFEVEHSVFFQLDGDRDKAFRRAARWPTTPVA